MKYLGYVLTVISLVAITLFSGCNEKFIPDPDDPRLPKYSEDGNMVSGALINDVAWKTQWGFQGEAPVNRAFYFTRFSNPDSITLTLDGYFTEGPEKGSQVSFTITLQHHVSAAKLDDIMLFQGKTFVLDGSESFVVIRNGFSVLPSPIVQKGTGALTVKKVKPVTKSTLRHADGTQYHPFIISGTFNFSFASQNIIVKSGRFDFSISDSYIDGN